MTDEKLEILKPVLHEYADLLLNETTVGEVQPNISIGMILIQEFC